MSQPEYDIFEDVVDIYETVKYEVESKYKSDTISNFCSLIDINHGYKNHVIDVCKEFVYLFKQFIRHYGTDENKPSTKKYPKFINFWLQLNLLRRSIPDTYNSDLLGHLKENQKTFDEKDKLNSKLFFIDPLSFKGMSMLYNLYKNYYATLHEYEDKCINFINEFKVNYDNCLYRCYAQGDTKLCDVMQKFRKLYDDQKFPKATTCNESSPLLPELSEYRSIHLSDSEDSNTGYKLVQASTFFNPFELPQLKGVNYKELNHLIWLQYNMPFQYDEEMKKKYMMNILQQFLQYCYDNKKNEKLSSFMKEFIIQYYNKSKEVYDDIFRECKTMSEEKTHCQLYKECKKKFSNDLSTIERNTEEYITQQKKYIESLSALELWIFKAQSMFQGFGAMSRISPTIMSTMVAIVVCVFFMYKLTPLSSIFGKEKKRRKIPLFFPERTTNYVKDDNSGHMKEKPKRGRIRFSYQPT
ncbi:PIR protein [Plasmodium vivax]|nr:PIR protein [Plasmodium vivax]